MRIIGTFIYGRVVYDRNTNSFVTLNRQEVPFNIEWPDTWVVCVY